MPNELLPPRSHLHPQILLLTPTPHPEKQEEGKKKKRKKTLENAVSTDSTIEVLIYIRHGTSTPQSKSAEKLNEAESVASPLPPQPLHSANSTGLPDQRITGGFGVSDQKSKEVSLQIQSFVDFYVREVKKDKQKKKETKRRR